MGFSHRMQPGLTGIPKVAILGAAAVDWVAHLKELPPLDGISYADEFATIPGGSGGNVAEALARLGHPVRFLGVLGDDEGGHMLMQAFESAGVDTRCIRVERDQRSATCFIAVDSHGQRMIFALGGVALYNRPGDITGIQLSGVKMLFIADAYPEVALQAISLLEPGSRVVFNPGGLMIAQGMKGLRSIMESTTLLILSQGEFETLTGFSDPQQACRVLAGYGPEMIMLTLAAQGVLVFDGKGFVQVPAMHVSLVKDTTGAGDAFSAGVIAGLLEGLSLIKSARLGCAVASYKIQYFGSRIGPVERSQIPSLL